MLGLNKYRLAKENIAGKIMLAVTFLSLLTVIVMGIGLYFKSKDVLAEKSLKELLFDSVWEPANNRFGFYSFIISSVYVTGLALLLAVPVSLLASLYVSENAKSWMRKLIMPVLDVLSGIPPVVYGVWGTLVIVPAVSEKIAPHFVNYTSGYSVISGAIVLAVMVVPLLISLFIEIFQTIPRDFKDASASLGATKWQTSSLVVIRKALPGIIAAVVLAVSRAFGETMAVLMVCGNSVEMPKNIFQACYPLSALIANNYGEMLSVPLYESALMFAALLMFLIILVFNTISRLILQQVERSFRL